METKICRICGEDKPLSAYSPSRGRLRSDCKSCHNVSSKHSVEKRRLNEALQAVSKLEGYDPEVLADEFNKPVLWIAHGLKACRTAGVSEEYFVGRYLKRDSSIVRRSDVEDAFKVLRGVFRVNDAKPV